MKVPDFEMNYSRFHLFHLAAGCSKSLVRSNQRLMMGNLDLSTRSEKKCIVIDLPDLLRNTHILLLTRLQTPSEKHSIFIFKKENILSKILP